MQDCLSMFDFQNTRRHMYHYNPAARCVDQPLSIMPHLGQCYGFLQCSILVAFGAAKHCPTCDNFLRLHSTLFANRIRWRCFFL